MKFCGVGIDPIELFTGKVDIHLIPSVMFKVHSSPTTIKPLTQVITEMGIAVPIRILRFILSSQYPSGNPGAL